MKRVVVATANHWSSPVTTGSHQYARLFARNGWEVAYLSDPVSPFHLLRPKSWLYNRHKFGLWARGGSRDLDDRLWAYNHLTLLPIFNAPLLRSPLAIRRSLDLSLPSLLSRLRDEGFGRPDLLWIEHLVFEGLLDRLDHGRSVYRLADDPELFPGPYPPALLARVPGFLERVGLVVATARRLVEKAREHRADGVVYLPNGVDYEHFADERQQPPDLARIPPPRVLYVGSLEPWFHVEAVAEAARAYPEFRFVIIGPVRTDLGALRQLANVHIFGPRAYDAVPAYMQHADVGIVPFRTSELMQTVHPIKVYEYLAAGLPVVSTDWEELALMKAPIRRAGSVAEFVDGIADAVKSSREPGPGRAYARANRWAARFEALQGALQTLPGR